MPPATGNGRSGDTDRYKRAATDALKVLDWCIWYFRYESQGNIATRLEQNRDYIRERLSGEPKQAPTTPRRMRPPADLPAMKPVRKLLRAIGLR